MVGGGKQSTCSLNQLTNGDAQCEHAVLAAQAAARSASPVTSWSDTCDHILQAMKNVSAADADTQIASTYRGQRSSLRRRTSRGRLH
jgi:hypothetical protein